MLHLSRSLAPTLLIGLAGCSGPGPLFTATQLNRGGAGGVPASGADTAGRAGVHEEGQQPMSNVEGGASGADAGAASAGGGAASAGGGASTTGGGGEGGTPPLLPSGGGPSGGEGPSAGSGGQVTTRTLQVEGVCKGKVASAMALLGNFENGVSGWSTYIDSSFAPPLSTAPGAAQTARAATFVGGYANESGLFHDMPCNDVSAFNGISFWAKGWGGDHVRFLAVIPATDPTTEGGDCNEATSVCWDHPGKLFVLSDHWQQYHVAWQDLAQEGWGSAASFSGVLNSVSWVNDAPVNAFEFSLDEVVLYAGDAP